MSIATVNIKSKILEAAASTFCEKGYGATSMDDVALASGEDAKTLMAHFASKDEILQSICFRIANEFFEIQEPILNSMSNPVLKLKELIAQHVNVIIQNIDAASVFFEEWRHLQEPGLSKFLEMREKYEKGFRDVFVDGITSGDFKPIDTNFTVRLLFSVINGIHEWYRTSGKVSPAEAGERMSEFILEGLKLS